MQNISILHTNNIFWKNGKIALFYTLLLVKSPFSFFPPSLSVNECLGTKPNRYTCICSILNRPHVFHAEIKITVFVGTVCTFSFFLSVPILITPLYLSLSSGDPNLSNMKHIHSLFRFSNV